METPWIVLVQRSVPGAEGPCVASVLLADAVARLALPMRVADAQAVRARVELVRNTATAASNELARAASGIAAAELFSLRGAAFNPTNPLPSIHHIPDGDHDARLALSLYQSARGCAEDACGYVESCCGHLRTVLNLLDSPGLPGVDGLLDGEHLVAQISLEAALDLAMASAVLAITAGWLLR